MSSFDLNGAVRFDLAQGRVTLRDTAADDRESRALVPMAALAALCNGVPRDVVADFGHRLGADLGRRLAAQAGPELDGASPQDIVDRLGGELALMGFGSLELELWGRAMVFAVSHSALLAETRTGGDDPGAELLAALFEGALTRGLRREAKVLPLARGSNEVRLLVCNTLARARVAAWLSDGCHYGEALARLNEAGATR